MALFDDACIQIQGYYVLVGSCIPQKDTTEVVPIQLSTAIARMFGAHMRSEYFKVFKIRLGFIVCLKWCVSHDQVDKTVMEIH
jgi:hypothetical protein